MVSGFNAIPSCHLNQRLPFSSSASISMFPFTKIFTLEWAPSYSNHAPLYGFLYLHIIQFLFLLSPCASLPPTWVLIYSPSPTSLTMPAWIWQFNPFQKLPQRFPGNLHQPSNTGPPTIRFCLCLLRRRKTEVAYQLLCLLRSFQLKKCHAATTQIRGIRMDTRLIPLVSRLESLPICRLNY